MWTETSKQQEEPWNPPTPPLNLNFALEWAVTDVRTDHLEKKTTKQNEKQKKIAIGVSRFRAGSFDREVLHGFAVVIFQFFFDFLFFLYVHDVQGKRVEVEG